MAQSTEWDPERRREQLANTLANQVASGGRIESQSEFQAVVVDGHRVNHVLHAIISFFTCGLWIVIWLVLGLSGGEKRRIVRVDQYGNTTLESV
jgi:hypothetical protein